MEADKDKVCVTGGTGFVASWLIMRLLQHGYSVHATVRPDPERRRDFSFLTSLPGASEKLQIFQADMSFPENFEAAIKGCIGVFHVATPVDFENKEREEVIVKRTIDGTLGILTACLNSRTVKRVVYTSSASAVESLKDIEGRKIPAVSSKKILDSGFEFKYGLEDDDDGSINPRNLYL
ncbi:hypothetical protein GH714_018594 [Hevea brasiliensis]|uniref:NAD-dependent epimerase/dehydratase domain-containing protein n=1 Tax=Hevea brasiliensis TaxID=3981 RepID=A0A6A6LB04_HEVBR|nr:hypothetical protein GH714_018594 [Hevea brasiliensis]